MTYAMKITSYIFTSLLVSQNVLAANACESIFNSRPVESVEFVKSDFMQATKVIRSELPRRVEALQKKYPNNIKLIKDVKINMNEEGVNWKGTRDILVVSLKNISQFEQNAMMADYVKYLSYGTVSFPLGLNAGHLYTRFGNTTFDFMGNLDANSYRQTSHLRLEPFIVLSPREQANLTTYLKNGVNEPDATLGHFDYDGVTSANRKLNDNKSCAGGHNCTSWIATAGIGNNRQSLMSMVGMRASTEQGTNPGWWSAYLNMKAPKERVPFSVYMDVNKSVKEVTDNLTANQNQLEWDFNPH